MREPTTAWRARLPGSARRRRTVAIVAVAVLSVAACSGGDDSSSDPAADAAPEAATAPTDAAGDDVAVTSDPVEPSTAAPTSSAAPATTSTTVPPPAVLPLGTVWTSTRLDLVGGINVAAAQLAVAQDELWVVGSRWNAPVVWRSADEASWTEVAVQPPPGSGSLGVDGLVERPDGGLLAWGKGGSDCLADIDRGEGYRDTSLCRRLRPVIYLSDDGAAWRRVDPPTMQPSGSTSVVIEDLTAVGEGFVAVGTHRGPDWYAVVWTSPDGERWEQVRELRGADGPMSAHQVLWDGSTLVVLAHEHPCSQGSINFNTPGWILGAGWARHLRMLSGPSAAELAPIDPAEHPILEPPLAVDCATASTLQLAEVPYPTADGAVVGGTITLVDFTPLPEPEANAGDAASDDEDDDSEQEPIIPRRLVSLVDGAWAETIVDGFDRGTDLLVDLGGTPALVRPGSAGVGRSAMEVVVPDPDGDGWVSRTSERPVLGDLIRSVVVVDGSIAVVSRLYPSPYESVRTAGDPVELYVSSTREMTEDEIEVCLPAAGETCAFAEFAGVAGYPDLAGSDFAGAGIWFADLGAADYSGASFAGARLVGATVDTSDGTPVFAGADFTGAVLQGADLEDVADANLAGADLRGGRIGFSTAPASLEGAVLAGTELELVPGPDGEYAEVELSLAGFDLSFSDINGPFDDEAPRLRVTDLRGAVLDFTSFYAVDLTGVLLDEGVDLAELRVWDNSICPDGRPPTDGPIGTCVRE